jgi:SpoVK/Ycf46/Vps4 family AAA+-type ATPase
MEHIITYPPPPPKKKPVDKLPEIKTLDDLIKLGKAYNKYAPYEYSFDLYRLYKITGSLEKLNKLIGMKKVKEAVVGHVLFFLSNLQDSNQDMLHTVIEGPPGVGKTLLGKIIGEIYYNLSIIQPPSYTSRERKVDDDDEQPVRKRRRRDEMTFVVAKRSDLIAKYLGQTAIKTQETINSALGGVLFIDEAYSLGNSEKTDSFSKECIDTINQNLSEKKNQLLCIIAGYKDALDKSFFAYNEGLSRRFPFRYTIEEYNYEELEEMFRKMVKEIGKDWEYRDNVTNLREFFKDNHEMFPNFGGDIETLVLNVKIEHAKRVYCLEEKDRKKVTLTDVKNAFQHYKTNKVVKPKDDRTSAEMMYI